MTFCNPAWPGVTMISLKTFLKTFLVASALGILALLGGCSCNQFDPHKYPHKGPFFEGWYMRIIDPNQKFTGGVLFGLVLPSTTDSSDQAPPAIASILSSQVCPRCSLKAQDKFFNASEVKISVGGHRVINNPDDSSPPNFEWAVPGGKFTCTANETRFDFTLGNVSLVGVAGPPTPWGPGGEGPEGWMVHLPLPLHWFVYSLDSPVLHYTYQDLGTGQKVTGRNAHAHLEKNWGKSFPSSWIWVEALNTSTGAVLSLSGGVLDLAQTFDVNAYLVGYRNPAKNIVLNYTPINGITKATHDGCTGTVNVTVNGLAHQLKAQIFARMESFSDCLYGPEESGFRRACVESFNAVAVVEVYSRFEKVLQMTLVDRQVIYNAALEFGGKFVCGDKCNKKI